jgi:hypothetical protein
LCKEVLITGVVSDVMLFPAKKGVLVLKRRRDVRSLSNSINSRVVVFGVAVVCVFCSAAAGNANLVGRWAFDEGSGTTAYNSAGENDGALINNPTWTTGQIGGALSFDGDGDYVYIGDLDLSGPFTLAFWMKPQVCASHLV